METIVLAILVIGLGGIMLAAFSRKFKRYERPFLWFSWGAHLASAVALWWLYAVYYGDGDIFRYYESGRLLTARLRFDFGQYFPFLVQAFFHQPTPIDHLIFGAGSSTGSTSVMTGLFMSFLNDSLVVSNLAICQFSFTGKVGIYLAFKPIVPKVYHRRLMFAAMAVPSTVFWTSGVIKESFSMFGMGWLFYGLALIVIYRKHFKGFIIALISFPFVSQIKAYILVPLVVATGALYLSSRMASAKREYALLTKPIYFVVGVAIAAGGFLVLGDLFPKYSIEGLPEEAARLQYYGSFSGGGSTYQFGDPTATTLEEQARFAPAGVFNTLFRPFIFEVHNPIALLNALETTFIMFLLYKGIRRSGVRGLLRMIMSSPVLLFSLLFVLIFATGVGLTTTNLGTLSRYRVPMMPFYFILLLLLSPPRRILGRVV